MSFGPRGDPRPPRLLGLLARLLIRGRDAAHIVRDLDASYARDRERGLARGRATRRYAGNVLASAWSVWGAGVHGLFTHGIGLDARLGLRMLAKQPLITLVAVLSLGLGIPGSLTLLHGFDVLLSELPVPEGDRVVGIRHYDVDISHPVPSTLHDLERWSSLASLESIGAVRSRAVNVNGEEVGAAPVRAAEITAPSFEVLRAQPVLGRMLEASDEQAGSPDVALIGEELWNARFGRDPEILGRPIRIGRTPHTVVGVMPADFRFPSSDQLWLPLRARAPDFLPGEGPVVLVFGRLADGVAMSDARVEMAGVTDRRRSDDPERFERIVGEVVDMPFLLLNEDDGVWRHSGLVELQTLIFALLLVVCGNVGTLILARTAARSAEITIRTALGASRIRVLTQLFVEALVLAVSATGFGLLLANALAAMVMRLLAPYELIPYWVDLTLTPGIVAVALGLAALCAALAGVLPAVSPTRAAIQANLQNSAARGGSVRFGVGPSLLIIGQITLSVGFLAFGATRVTSAVAHQGRGLGFDPERYLIGTLTVPAPDELNASVAVDSVAWTRRVERVQRELLARLSDDPAVVGVAMADDPPGLEPRNRSVILETPPPAGFERVGWDTFIPHVHVSFFDGLNRPILAGRDFNEGDVEGPPGTRHTAVIVNESFVRDHLGGRNPVGQRLRYESQGTIIYADDEWYEIVGVVGAFGANPWNSARDAAIYHPIAAGAVNPMQYAVEVAGDAEAFVTRLRQVAASVDGEATVRTSLLAETIRTEGLFMRSAFLLVVLLAGVTFLLAATGLYALMSFTVTQRTREIGIRTALGARSADIVLDVTQRAVLQIGIGLVLGVGFGWRLLGVDRNDLTLEVGNAPLTLVLTASVAAAVCLFACARPTLRGLRIQPTEALRES